MLRTFFYLPLIFIVACTGRPKTDTTPKKVSTPWQYLTLQLNDTIIHLTKTVDSMEVSAFKQRVEKYKINKTEKDSLFKQANDLMDFEKQPERFCTDYVGKLKVQIVYNSQLAKEVSFSSICDWRELDTNTARLDQLVRKILSSK